MVEIELAPIPNQSFSIRLDDSQYDIAIRETNGCMSASITRDNIEIVSNTRIVAGFPIIPYRYLENGNFVITTLNEELPYYTEFGNTQFLIYASQVELMSLPAAS
jgi:hypothetical protein